MIFRFNIERLVLPNNENLLQCSGVTESIVANVSGEFIINGTSFPVADFASVSIPDTPVGNVGFSAILEAGNVVAAQVSGLELWESATLEIILNLNDHYTYRNVFTVFGYDLGNNPLVVNSDGVPIDYNTDINIVLVPSIAGVNQAQGRYNADVYTIADNYGTIGNGITITGDGVLTLLELVVNYNAANPDNTISASFPFISEVIPFGETVTTSGGVDAEYQYPYANVIGWAQPFTNTHYLYDASSSIGESVYTIATAEQVGLGLSATRCCTTDATTTLTKTSYRVTPCGSREVIGVCDDTVDVETYNLIPTYFATLTCPECCETEDECLIVDKTYTVNASVSANGLSTMYIDDESQIATETVEIAYELYNNKGIVTDSNTAVWDYETNVAPIWTTTIPKYGDYILLYKVYVEGVFECSVPYNYTGCHYYYIDQLECGKYRIYNYNNEALPIVVSKLNDESAFEEVTTDSVDACSYKDIEFSSDGVYNIFANGTPAENLVVVVDCNIRKCFVDYMLKLACSDKATCSCGGKCASGCSAIPFDFYNFNAFMSMSYGYYSLLNEEYLDHYIYAAVVGDETDFGQEDLARLQNINVFIQRATEYCSECEAPRDVTGCVTCK
jgi:hypothetical protein